MNLSSTEIAILAALIGQPLYGLALLDEVRRVSEGQVSLTLGGVYPVLYRMQKKGLIEGYWGDESEIKAGARRRYYRVTGLGERAMESTRRMLSLKGTAYA